MQIAIDVARVTPSGILEVEGWAAGEETVSKIEIRLGEQALGPPLTGVARPDVLAAHPQYLRAGACGYLLRTELGDERLHEQDIRIRVETESGASSLTRSLETPPKIVRVPPSDDPLLYNLDDLRVEPNGVVTLSGWAASPQTIVKIGVLLDLDFIGHATYGLVRPDVGNAHPTIPSARYSGLRLEVRLRKLLNGRHVVTLLMLTKSGAVLSCSHPGFVAPASLDTDKRETPGRLTTTTQGRPSWRSGFNVLKGCEGELAGRWICEPKIDDRLRNQVLEAADIEPAINPDLLLQLGLHRSSGQITDQESAYIAAVRSCARCHCLVVSEFKLDERQVRRLLSAGRRFVNSARPWLTLLSVAAPVVGYWHRNNGLRRETAYAPVDADAAAGFTISVAAASMANQLVVAADSLGVAVLRKYGARIFGTAPQVSLLAHGFSLSDEDMVFLREFVAMNFVDFQTVIAGEGVLRAVGADIESPRALVVSAQEPGAIQFEEGRLPSPIPQHSLP